MESDSAACLGFEPSLRLGLDACEHCRFPKSAHNATNNQLDVPESRQISQIPAMETGMSHPIESDMKINENVERVGQEKQVEEYRECIKSLEDHQDWMKTELSAHADEAEHNRLREQQLAETNRQREEQLVLLYNKQMEDVAHRAQQQIDLVERDKLQQVHELELERQRIINEAQHQVVKSAEEKLRIQIEAEESRRRIQALEAANQSLLHETHRNDGDQHRKLKEQSLMQSQHLSNLAVLSDIEDTKRHIAAELQQERNLILEDIHKTAMEEEALRYRRDKWHLHQTQELKEIIQSANEATRELLEAQSGLEMTVAQHKALGKARERNRNGIRRRKYENSPRKKNYLWAETDSIPEEDFIEDENLLEINVACKNLLQMDWLSMVHPLVAVFERRDNPIDGTKGQFYWIDQTEWLRSTLNPKFETTFIIRHIPGTGQQYMFRVYDVDQRMISEQVFQGSAIVDLDDLVQKNISHQVVEYPLRNINDTLLDQQLDKEGSHLLLKYWSHTQIFHRERNVAHRSDGMQPLQCELMLEANNLPEDIYDDGDDYPNLIIPMACVFMVDRVQYEDGKPRRIDQTECWRELRNPAWRKKIIVDYFPGHDQELKISVYDTNTTNQKIHEKNRIGSAYVRLQKLSAVGTRVKRRLINHRIDNYSSLEDPYIIVTCTQTFRYDQLSKCNPQSVRARSNTKKGQQPVVQVTRVDGEPSEHLQMEVVKRAICVMTDGRSMKRYFLNKKYAYISLFYSSRGVGLNGQTMPCLYWCAERKRESNPTRQMEITSINSIIIGKQCKAFHTDWASRSDERKCFSLINDDNALHLEVQSENQRDIWIFGIQSLMQQLGNNPTVYQRNAWKIPNSPKISKEEDPLYSKKIVSPNTKKSHDNNMNNSTSLDKGVPRAHSSQDGALNGNNFASDLQKNPDSTCLQLSITCDNLKDLPQDFKKDPEYYLVVWSKKGWKDLAQTAVDPEFPERVVFNPKKISVYPGMKLGIYIYDGCEKEQKEPYGKEHMVGHVNIDASELLKAESRSLPLERLSIKKTTQDPEIMVTITSKVVSPEHYS